MRIMKYSIWTSLIGALFLAALTNSLPVPEDSSVDTASSDENSPSQPVLENEELEGSESQGNKAVRSIDASDSGKYGGVDADSNLQQPMQRITKALEEVSQQLGTGFKNFGNSAIQILEGVDVAAEQALGTGARIVTGIAETAAETAETGARKAIRIANGVANTLTQGTKTIVNTQKSLLEGLTGAIPSSSLQGDASTNDAVQRNERANANGFGGYPSTSYGPNTVAETPNNFINVFSQATANTVNFGTQLLNSVLGVAVNVLQGTISTLLSMLNAKGQIVGAVVQSAPPVLASVTRTAGDVLAAKARIFGAVTQGGIRALMDNGGIILNTTSQVTSKAVDSGRRIFAASGKSLRISVGAVIRAIQSISESTVNFASQLAQTLTNTFSALFNNPNPFNLAGGGGGSSGGYGGGGRATGGTGSGPAALLGGVGNLAQTAVNTKLNLLNGILSPFTGGRPLLNFGGSGGTAAATGRSNPFAALLGLASQNSANTNRPVRYFPSSPSPRTPRTDPSNAEAISANAVNFLSSLTTLGRTFTGMLDQINDRQRPKNIARGPDTAPPPSSSASSSAPTSFLAQILPNAKKVSNNEDNKKEAERKRLEQSVINSLLRSISNQ